ncbi:MAG: helix-turn-helix domain-containing protein [Clostridia bacterium]|nr:helix-turn-helix domain-containing protein [Clostridia bacterium]
MKFNERLLDLRKKNGWSQEELGEKLDVSRQTISKWESGQTTPELEKLRNLAKLFNISVDELINEDEPVEENNIEKDEFLNTEKISKKKRSKIKTLLIYMFVVIFIFYIVLVIYRYNIIIKISESFWNIIMESNNNGYYMEKRTFGEKFNVGDPMTREEHYYYNNWFDTTVAEENEIGRVKIKKYTDSLLNSDKLIYVDNIWINSDERSIVTEFDETNKTYKRINNYEYLSYAYIIMAEYENTFNALDFYEDWPNYLRYALDLRIDIFEIDEGYYISNERINAPKQENHCYMIINDSRIIFEKVDYDTNMKANYDVTRYKLRLGTSEEEVSFPDLTEYTLIEE